MTIATIDALPALTRTSPTFRADVNSFFATLLNIFISQANALAADVNSKQSAAATSATAAGVSETNANVSKIAAAASAAAAAASAAVALGVVNNPSNTSTSASSVAVGTGAKSFTVADTGRNWAPGMELLIWKDATNYMVGRVTSYSGTSLGLDVHTAVGAGTYTAWTISTRLSRPYGNPIPITASATVGLNAFYEVFSSFGPLTVTLPPNPIHGDYVRLRDVDGVAGAKRITVARNGNLIAGLAENFIGDVDWIDVTFFFDSTKGWTF